MYKKNKIKKTVSFVRSKIQKRKKSETKKTEDKNSVRWCNGNGICDVIIRCYQQAYISPAMLQKHHWEETLYYMLLRG